MQDVLLDAMAKLEELERDAATIRHALAAIVAAGHNADRHKTLDAVRASDEAQANMGGMPCVADICWDGNAPKDLSDCIVLPALAHDASAAIPARIHKLCTEGGE